MIGGRYLPLLRLHLHVLLFDSFGIEAVSISVPILTHEECTWLVLNILWQHALGHYIVHTIVVFLPPIEPLESLL